jgi:hypothetical protein
VELSSNRFHCESKVAVAAARGQFGKSEEGERPPLEAGTGGVVKRQQTENTPCVPWLTEASATAKRSYELQVSYIAGYHTETTPKFVVTVRRM